MDFFSFVLWADDILGLFLSLLPEFGTDKEIEAFSVERERDTERGCGRI